MKLPADFFGIFWLNTAKWFALPGSEYTGVIKQSKLSVSYPQSSFSLLIKRIVSRQRAIKLTLEQNDHYPSMLWILFCLESVCFSPHFQILLTLKISRYPQLTEWFTGIWNSSHWLLNVYTRSKGGIDSEKGLIFNIYSLFQLTHSEKKYICLKYFLMEMYFSNLKFEWWKWTMNMQIRDDFESK